MPLNVATLRCCTFALLLAGLVNTAATADAETGSYHLGMLHPAGVDVAGYTSEKPLGGNVYRFYTFGLPALAAVGFNYYEHYGNTGFTATAGVGLGSVAYASAGYQWRLEEQTIVKTGAGYTTGIAYTGWYPVLAYEKHFE